eukprot:10990713-Alexandrium_andersonii.AAC.1
MTARSVSAKAPRVHTMTWHWCVSPVTTFWGPQLLPSANASSPDQVRLTEPHDHRGTLMPCSLGQKLAETEEADDKRADAQSNK